MLNKEDNDGNRNFAGELVDDLRVQHRHLSVRKAARDRSKDAPLGIFGRRLAAVWEIAVARPADKGVQQNHKGCAKGIAEEPHLSAVRLLPRKIIEGASDDVEHSESCQAECGVQTRRRQSLQSVNDHLVGFVSSRSVRESNAHESLDLTDRNRDR